MVQFRPELPIARRVRIGRIDEHAVMLAHDLVEPVPIVLRKFSLAVTKLATAVVAAVARVTIVKEPDG